MEVMHFLEIKTYQLTDEEKVLIMKNWLATQKLSQLKRKKCKTVKGLFSILSQKFKLHHNRVVLSM